MEINEWPDNEHSTRNCYHCKLKGQMAVCKYGVNAFYKTVVKFRILLLKCTDCEHFEDFQEVK